MNTKALKLFTCMLWAGVATSAATPASAKMRTTQSGTFAVCSAWYALDTLDSCDGVYSYRQNIRLVTAPCNFGHCEEDAQPRGEFVEFLYPNGRHKIDLQTGVCDIDPTNVYELGGCEC